MICMFMPKISSSASALSLGELHGPDGRRRQRHHDDQAQDERGELSHLLKMGRRTRPHNSEDRRLKSIAAVRWFALSLDPATPFPQRQPGTQ